MVASTYKLEAVGHLRRPGPLYLRASRNLGETRMTGVYF